METSQQGSSKMSEFRRPDKVLPYRLNFWADIIMEDTTTEVLNILGMLLSLVSILMKYKSLAWLGILVAAVSYANSRSNHEVQQVMSSFMLAISSIVMCYIYNPMPMSMNLGSGGDQQLASQPANQSTQDAAH